MSADNGIYILTTRDNHKRTSEYTTENMLPNGILAYRVAYCQGVDNIDYAIQHEPHNIGFYLHHMFGNAPIFYDYNAAKQFALDQESNYSYLEYGVSEIDLTNLNFPGY